MSSIPEQTRLDSCPRVGAPRVREKPSRRLVRGPLQRSHQASWEPQSQLSCCAHVPLRWKSWSTLRVRMASVSIQMSFSYSVRRHICSFMYWAAQAAVSLQAVRTRFSCSSESGAGTCCTARTSMLSRRRLEATSVPSGKRLLLVNRTSGYSLNLLRADAIAKAPQRFLGEPPGGSCANVTKAYLPFRCKTSCSLRLTAARGKTKAWSSQHGRAAMAAIRNSANA
mmetsp:Transcript_95365/g.253374  ORF Transcript_95365/g.253374 Transcript_95365/m.253374 type:complete len:225 (+) Transcript_95365:469-1143(+)